MDRSLWLLTSLRLKAAYRRWKRSLARPRGIVVTIVFCLLFAPSLGSVVAMAFVPPSIIPTGWADRFGPIGLFAMFLISLAGSTGDSALYFPPAEVDFLFSGPFHRRQLIAYKLTTMGLTTLVLGLFFGLSSQPVAPWYVAACCGSLLMIAFFTLSQIVLGLGTNLLGMLVWNRAKQAAGVILLGFLGLITFANRTTLLATNWQAFGLAVERSPITLAVLTPFRWFVATFTAQTWSGLLNWGSLALGVNLLLIGLIFALDAGYIEASSLASSRLLARARKMVGSGGALKLTSRQAGRWQVRLPPPQWLGGIGPNLWRQMTTALGDPAKLCFLAAVFGGVCYLVASIMPRGEETRSTLLPIAAVAVVPLTVLFGLLFSFDFRSDLDVMETLKTLPIRPTVMALGQILTPAILATLIQSAAGLGLIAGSKNLADWPLYLLAGLVVVFPANLLFFGVENLLFLWYPMRIKIGQFNGQAVVRQLIVTLAKLVVLGAIASVVAAVALVGFLLFDPRISPALWMAGGTTVGFTVVLLPILGRAFTTFDVNHDIPA